MIAKIAFRNIFRHKRRSILTGMLMAGVCFLHAVSLGMVDVTYGGIIDMFTRDSTGHIQIHGNGYIEKPSIYKTVYNADEIGARIEGMPDVESWTPRVRTPALAFAGTKTTGIEVIGVDPIRESQTTRLKNKVKEGRFISEEMSYDAVITGSLSRVLKVEIGGEIALISQGADGSIANDLFTVVGITDSEDTGYGKMFCYVHIEAAQEFLALEKRVHEIAIVMSGHEMARKGAKAMESILSDPDLDVEPWQIVEEQFYRAMQADLEGNKISLLILTLIVAVGVLNTALMVILERTPEFGLLKALGTRPFMIFRLIVLETAFISVISVIVGTAFGIGGNYLLSIYGIDYPTPLEYGGMMFETLTAVISPRSLYQPGLTIFLTAVFVSTLPAIKAARVIPVKSMRTE
jgi:ABC-type lipoprotein release transport system permease subunit